MRQIWIPGAALGTVSGLLVGLSMSPIAGIAVTALVSVAAAIVGAGADTDAMLAARWRYFGSYAVSLCVFFAVGAGVGFAIRSSMPTPADTLEKRLIALGVPNDKIGEILGDTVSNSSSPAVVLGSGVFYSSPNSTNSTGLDGNAATTSAAVKACGEVPSPPWDAETINKLRKSSIHALQDAGAIVDILEDSSIRYDDKTRAELKLRRLICGD